MMINGLLYLQVFGFPCQLIAVNSSHFSNYLLIYKAFSFNGSFLSSFSKIKTISSQINPICGL
jgi:hypothetical protein